jgi:hypothetical protein
MTVRNTVVWDVSPCSLVRSYILGKPAAAIKMAAAGLVEILANFCQITGVTSCKKFFNERLLHGICN